MFDYTKDKYFNYKQKELYNLKLSLINGYIYRGDTHKNTLIVKNPKFFGSYYASSHYISESESYIKKFSTTKELKLLNHSNTSKAKKPFNLKNRTLKNLT